MAQFKAHIMMALRRAAAVNLKPMILMHMDLCHEFESWRSVRSEIPTAIVYYAPHAPFSLSFLNVVLL